MQTRVSTKGQVVLPGPLRRISTLPSWVKSPAQTTDGHLLQLAKANGAVLATLDAGIPGAYLIP
jgi:hypothetical protein